MVGMGWRWLLLLALADGFAVVSARMRRQASPHSVLGGGSSRWHPHGAARRYGWRSQVMPPEGASRQLAQPLSPVSLQCEEGSMVVNVRRDLFGDGRMVRLSDLELGTRPCNPDPKSSDTMAVFNVDLQDCGITVEMTADHVIYSTTLIYNQTSASSPIYRTHRAVIPISCSYPRHANVSSKAIHPTWIPFGSTIASEEKLTFSLQLMTDDWKDVRPSFFYTLGEILHIEASVDAPDHIPLILYVDSCVATTSLNTDLGPRYKIITHHGCLVDGMEEGVTSSFMSPRVQANQIQFTVDAFRFLDEETSEMYINCDLTAIPTSEIPNPMNKACSYNKASDSWFPLEGPTDVCQCCDTGNCELVASNTRRWGSVFGRPKGSGKREAIGPLSEAFVKATLGPLVVGTALKSERWVSSDPWTIEMWVLVAVVSVSVVVVVVGIGVIGKRLLNRGSSNIDNKE